MKKGFKLLVITISLLALSACSGQAVAESTGQTASTTAAPGVQAAGSGTDTGTANQLEGETRLAVGILKLDGTEHQVSPEQAPELLLLWQAVQSLSGSDTAATEEIQGLFDQIEDTLTGEQRQAIAGMDLTGETMSEVFQSLGIEPGSGIGAGRFGDLTEEQRATMEAARESGQMPGGGFGGGAGMRAGGGVPGELQGAEINPELQATLQARRESGQAGVRVSPVLLQAVIQYLESLAN